MPNCGRYRLHPDLSRDVSTSAGCAAIAKESRDAVYVVGVVFIVMGILLACNVARVAGRLAAISRSSPWWMKGPASDSEWSWRILGMAMAVIGSIFLVLQATGYFGRSDSG